MATFEDVRRISLALPEATELLTWDTDATFRVRNKIFAISSEGAGRVSIKSTPFVQEDLIDRDPATFAKAAYVGRFGWVSMDLERVELAELEALLFAAWRLTAPRKVAATTPRRTTRPARTTEVASRICQLLERGKPAARGGHDELIVGRGGCARRAARRRSRYHPGLVGP